MKQASQYADLDTANQSQAVQCLAKFLSDTYVLYVKTQNFHWNDEGTLDLFIQRTRVHDKTAWMLRSHLQES